MIRTLALALLLTLALAMPALAQGGPSQDGYTPDGPQAVEQTSGSGNGGNGSDPGDPRAANSGSLPFTGMDLVLVAALGAGLLGVGVGMRRLTRPADPASL